MATRRGTWKNSLDPYWMLLEYDRRDGVRGALNPEDIPNKVYLEKLENILSGTQFIGVPPDPTNIINSVYLGTQAQGENFDLLRRFKIKFVLNCAGVDSPIVKKAMVAKYREAGIVYDEINADDREDYQIFRDFGAAHAFIEGGHYQGRVLIYCNGVSRSGAIALSYMVRMGRRLLQAAQDLKDARRVVICNFSFMKQVVDFASCQGMLDPEPYNIKTPEYGRKLDSRRIWSAHLPLIL